VNVAFLGWARLSAQEREGSGYNLSASELAAGLAERGHRVAYLRSGMDYGVVRAPHVRHFETWRDVACFDLVNSPNLSPAGHNFRNMAAELRSPEQTALVLAWLDEVGAELVHVHSLEGFPLDTIEAIRATARPVVVTPHNYWYVCPQVDLLYQERELCFDYAGGRRCATCIECLPPASARRRRAIWQSLERKLGTGATAFAHAKLVGLRRRMRGQPADAALAPPPSLGASPLDQNERFLAATHHRVAENAYGERRAAGVAALNRASVVIPPSDFLCRVHAAMGVEERLLRVVRLGAPHFDRIHRRARLSPFYQQRPWSAKDARTPLRFGFLGTTRNNKGLRVLVDAIPLLPEEVRRRCQFLIRASGDDRTFRSMLSAYPEVQFAGGYDAQQLLAAAGEYDVGVMTHVWFENSPLVLLEHLHAGKFTLSPRLGGPPEWITPPANGLLYAGGHPEALAQCIAQLVDGSVAIPSPSEIHEVSPLRSFADHVAEVEAVYREARG
jgi:glycosyltransferase involved in cell wall biosynthesis